MYRIYEAWKAYAILIVEAVMAYCERTQHFVVSIGSLILPLFAVDWFLPRWAALSIYAAIGLPLAWFLGSMFWVFFAHEHNRQRRY